MTKDSNVLTLQTLLGDYSNTLALKKGDVRSPESCFRFCRRESAEHRVQRCRASSEVRCRRTGDRHLLAGQGIWQTAGAVACGGGGRVPHPFLVYNAERGRITPADLKGRRVGIRAYSVTTAAWIRGILQNDHGVDLDSINWVTFEDPHVAEYHDPATAERAPAGKQLVKMLLDGEIDAGVVGGPDLNEPRLQPVIPSPAEAAHIWCQRYGALPINHMVVVKDR